MWVGRLGSFGTMAQAAIDAGPTLDPRPLARDVFAPTKIDAGRGEVVQALVVADVVVVLEEGRDPRLPVGRVPGCGVAHR